MSTAYLRLRNLKILTSDPGLWNMSGSYLLLSPELVGFLKVSESSILHIYTFRICVCAQSPMILCDTMDCSLPGSSVHGIFQATIQEWVAIPTPGDLSNPGIEPMYLVSPALSGRLFTIAPSGKPTFRTRSIHFHNDLANSIYYNCHDHKGQKPI